LKGRAKVIPPLRGDAAGVNPQYLAVSLTARGRKIAGQSAAPHY